MPESWRLVWFIDCLSVANNYSNHCQATALASEYDHTIAFGLIKRLRGAGSRGQCQRNLVFYTAAVSFDDCYLCLNHKFYYNSWRALH